MNRHTGKRFNGPNTISNMQLLLLYCFTFNITSSLSSKLVGSVFDKIIKGYKNEQ